MPKTCKLTHIYKNYRKWQNYITRKRNPLLHKYIKNALQALQLTENAFLYKLCRGTTRNYRTTVESTLNGRHSLNVRWMIGDLIAPKLKILSRNKCQVSNKIK